MSEENTFSPFKIGELVPYKGFYWQVVDCNKSDVVLRVHSTTGAGEKKGLRVTYKKDSPLSLNEEAKIEIG